MTAADYVRDRFDSRFLALAVAMTGIVATLPYIAVQLIGMEVVIGGLGFPAGGFVGHLPLIIAFIVLAAFTYTSGLRAPALIAIVKDVLVFVVVFAAVGRRAGEARRPWNDLRQRPGAEADLAIAPEGSLGSYSAYVTLAVGFCACAVSFIRTRSLACSALRAATSSRGTLRRSQLIRSSSG